MLYGGEKMKRGMVFVTALALAATVLFAGCGEMRGTDGNTVPPTGTPAQTMLPETMMPDPEDGVVRDRDGIITDGDSGTVNGSTDGSGVNGNTGSGTAANGKVMPNTAQTGKR